MKHCRITNFHFVTIYNWLFPKYFATEVWLKLQKQIFFWLLRQQKQAENHNTDI